MQTRAAGKIEAMASQAAMRRGNVTPMTNRDETPRRVDVPEVGFFSMRLVRLGPYVAARIEHSPAGWRATIDGQTFEPNPDPAYAKGVFQIWHGGKRIREAEYRHMLHVRDWAKREAPRHPAANPRRRINIKNDDALF